LNLIEWHAILEEDEKKYIWKIPFFKFSFYDRACKHCFEILKSPKQSYNCLWIFIRTKMYNL